MSPSVASLPNPGFIGPPARNRASLTGVVASEGQQLTKTPADVGFAAVMQQQVQSESNRWQSRNPVAATNSAITAPAHTEDVNQSDEADQRALQPKATPTSPQPGFDAEPKLGTHLNSQNAAAVAGNQIAFPTNPAAANRAGFSVVSSDEAATETPVEKAAPVVPSAAIQVAPQETCAARSTETSNKLVDQPTDLPLQPASSVLPAKALAPVKATNPPAGNNAPSLADTRTEHQEKKPVFAASSAKIPAALGPSATTSHGSEKPSSPDSPADSPAVATMLPVPAAAPNPMNQAAVTKLPSAASDPVESAHQASKGSWVRQTTQETMQPANSSTVSEGHLQTSPHGSPQTRLETNPTLKPDHTPTPATTTPAATAHASLQIPAIDAPTHTRANSAVAPVSSALAAALPAVHSASAITSGVTGVRQAPSAIYAAPSATFDRLDSAAAPQTLESTPQRLTVGVQNSGLGWVEIRTNRDAGQISATVTTGSVESHAALSAQLPAVREYLAEHQVQVDSLGSERFSQSSGNREGSTQQQSPQQGAGENRNPEPIHAPVSSDSDADELSYISVRV